jgi:antitoxin MazE
VTLVRVRVKKWGNSLALRIPKPFAEETAVREGAIVDLSIEDGRLVATPAAPEKYSLKRMICGVSSKNLHVEAFRDQPTGREVW